MTKRIKKKVTKKKGTTKKGYETGTKKAIRR